MISPPSCGCPRQPCLCMERTLWERGLPAVGMDEVGRGTLVAATIVCAVQLDPGPGTDYLLEAGVADSKKLPQIRIETLAPLIRAHAAAVGVGAASAREIDRLGLGPALRLAMQRALRRVGSPPHVLVDGVHVAGLGTEQTSVVCGDARCLAIAAASVVAKQVQKTLLTRLGVRFPAYGWESNAGYGTAEHQAAIEAHGLTRHHRKSFGAQGNLF